MVIAFTFDRRHQALKSKTVNSKADLKKGEHPLRRKLRSVCTAWA